MNNLGLRIGFFLTLLLLILGILAPWIAPYNPYAISLPHELQSPSRSHLLGTDANGTDILSVMLYGARTSLKISLLVSSFAIFIGLILGSIAGYFGGWIDVLIMRMVDIVFAFPGILLAIALGSMLGPSEFNLVLCLVCTSWAGYARLVRAEVLALKKMEFMEAAFALGVPTPRIFLFYLWPNLASPLLVAGTFGIAGTILAEASLSFLGIGIPPGDPSWGSLLSFGRDVLLEAPHVAIFPGIAIAVTVLSLHLLGEGLRRKYDPKSL